MATLKFQTLLYRYFFFGWLFEDVCHGDLYQRSAAWKHNTHQSRWLPTYMRRWIFVSLLMYTLGSVCEIFLKAPVLSACFFVPMAVSATINTVIGAMMIGFKILSGPL
jgi:hypothetical protein